MNMESLLNQVRDNIEEAGLLEKGDGVVAGVSGGADSICLLKVLKELKDEYSLDIIAVHVHHGLRGAEADADCEFVRDVCRDWDIPLRVFHADVNSLSRERQISLEEAGREARYELFGRVMEECRLKRIAVAHNLDDQAETVMLHILRGTGLDGLSGMRMKQGSIIRPLLNVSRKSIEEYLNNEKIRFRVDSTNLENHYTRNKIRNILFPKIAEEFGVNPSHMLSRLSFLVQEDKDYLDDVSLKAFERLICHSDKLALDLSGFNSYPRAIQKRIIRHGWERINKNRKNLEQVHVEQILNLCKNKHTGKMVELPGGIIASVSYDKLVFSRGIEKKQEFYEYSVNTEGKNIAPEAHGILEARLLTAEEAYKMYGSPGSIRENSLTQMFDYDSLGKNILLRNRRDGDRIRPFGSRGEKKLKDYFIDNKIPQGERSKIPLVAKDNRIVWVIGKRTSQDFRPRKDSKNILVLSWLDLQDGGELE